MQPLRIVCVSACLLGLAASPLAQAEEGEFQLGFGTRFLGYSSTTVEPEEGDETKTSGFTWGIGHDNPVHAELGYGVTPNLVVGGLVQLGGTSMTEETGDAETDRGTFRFLLAPKLDYVILPGDKVQPFVGGVLGYAHASNSWDNDAGEASTTTSGFLFMARGGLRLFPGKEFSIDPWLALGYFTGSQDTDNPGDGPDFENDLSELQFMVYVTLSGWID